MWSYQYKHGDRPLDGYTIQRAAGRGGFGEVYYAISDSGREVALKVVTGYEQIEVRGISQCMNLKSPNLVSIFDVKYNAQGKPFVIMEFVSGPSLRQLIDENPSGLGEQKSAFFLREIAKGLSYLHDCGIVHRDLKPGNVFYENGYVKIGDYGLSKAIATSPNSGQTVTVGTVHYMAPEVGAGKYDRGIDIYALGAVLFEMLTGVPPFVGASPSEVLLKHLSAQPDCTGISEPFCTAIRKAMAKDPNDRYKSVQEMVEAVFGSEHVRQSMSVFSTEELSMVAGRVAKNVVGGSAGVEVAPPPTGAAQRTQPQDRWEHLADKFERVGEKIADRAARFGEQVTGRPVDPSTSADASRDFTIPVDDTLPAPARRKFVLLSVLVFAVAGAMLSPRKGFTGNSMQVALMVAGAIGGALIAFTKLRPRMLPPGAEPIGLRRWIVSALTASGTLPGAMLFGAAINSSQLPYTLAAIAVPLFIFDLERHAKPDRRERVQIGCVIGSAVIAFFLAIFFGGAVIVAVAIAAGTSMALQAASAWRPRLPTPAMAGVALNNPRPLQGYGNDPTAAAHAGAATNFNVQGSEAQPAQYSTGGATEQFWWQPVAPALRYIWVALLPLTMAACIASIAAASNSRRPNDLLPFTIIASLSGAIALTSLSRALTHRYFGVWHYLLRPIIRCILVAAGITAAVSLSNLNLRPADIGVGVFFLIFSAVSFLVLLFIPGKHIVKRSAGSPTTAPAPQPQSGGRGPDALAHANISPYKRLWALLLMLGWFGSVAGLHRFYVGKIATGILWLCTGGLMGIGQLIDLIMLLNGSFKDKKGRPLVLWEDDKELSNLPEADLIKLGKSRVKAMLPLSARGTTLGRHGRGLLSALAGLLIFFGTMFGVALALQVPVAIDANVFGPEIRELFTVDLFNGYSNWPDLATQVGALIAGLLFLQAIVVAIFARRAHGWTHQLRGIAGIAGLVLMIVIAAANFSGQIYWPMISSSLGENRIPEALNEFLDAWRPGIVVAMFMFIAAITLLGWPPKGNVTPSAAVTPAPAGPQAGTAV